MRITMVGLVGALAGCDELGLDAQVPPSGPGGVDSAEPEPALRIDDLEPDWAPTAGGVTVTVRGAGFDQGSAIWFGGTELTTTWIDATTLTVTAPAVMAEATIDVKVAGALGEYTLSDAFTYSDSGPPPDDTGEPDDTDTPPDDTGAPPSGLTGGLVEIWYQAYFCAECFGLTSQLQVSAGATFHAPTAGSWLDWIPPSGYCTDTYSPSSLTSSGEDVGEWVYLSAGAASLPLRRTTQGGTTSYLVEGLQQADYVKNSAYDVSTSDGSLTLDGAVLTGTGFDDIVPIELVYDDLYTAFSAPIRASNATIGWAPSGTSADMLLVVEVYHPHTGASDGIILCRGEDTGSITVPSSMFYGKYYEYSSLVVSFYRLLITETISPLDGSTIEGVSLYGGIGTGILVP